MEAADLKRIMIVVASVSSILTAMDNAVEMLHMMLVAHVVVMDQTVRIQKLHLVLEI